MWPDDHIIVWYDSKNPEPFRRVAGRWFEFQVDLLPRLRIPGTKITDGLNVYETLAVEGPLFEVDGIYIPRCMGNDLIPPQDIPPVKVLARIKPPMLGWIYTVERGYKDGPKKPKIHTEQGLLRYLTQT